MEAPEFLLKHRLAHISSLSKPFQGLHILFQRKMKLLALKNSAKPILLFVPLSLTHKSCSWERKYLPFCALKTPAPSYHKECKPQGLCTCNSLTLQSWPFIILNLSLHALSSKTCPWPPYQVVFSPSIVRCHCILFISFTAAITKWFIPLTDFTDCTPTRLSSMSSDANACSQVPCGPWTCLISPLGFSKMITQLMVVAKWRKEELYGWFILIFGRNKHNTIRQLPLNLKKDKQMKKGRNERLNKFISPFVTRHKRRTCTISRLHHWTQDITAWNLNWREFCIIWSFFTCPFLLHFRGRGQWKGLEPSLGSGSPHPSQPCFLFDGDKTRQAPD